MHIYQIGYAHFFNGDTTWCNDIQFRYLPPASPTFGRQYLTQQIRQDFNTAIDMVHQIYRDVIADIGVSCQYIEHSFLLGRGDDYSEP